MSTYFFRNAKTSDASRVSDLVNSAYRGESSKAGWTTEESILGGQRTDAGRIQAVVETPDTRIVLCFQDPSEKKLLACVNLKKESATTLYLGMLTVEPKLQGGGVGKAMLLESERIARELGCSEIRMTVIHLRSELLAYYERRGYAKTGAWEPFPETDPGFGLPKVKGMKLLELKKPVV